MRDFSFIDEETSIEWTRVDKRIARRAYNNGTRVLVFKHKYLPAAPDRVTWTKEELDDCDFDHVGFAVKHYLDLPQSEYLDYYLPSAKIPPYYNYQRYTYNIDGKPVTGTLYYLCDKPTREFVEQSIRYNNVYFVSAQAQYAPEQIKPIIFIPDGTYIQYL